MEVYLCSVWRETNTQPVCNLLFCIPHLSLPVEKAWGVLFCLALFCFVLVCLACLVSSLIPKTLWFIFQQVFFPFRDFRPLVSYSAVRYSYLSPLLFFHRICNSHVLHVHLVFCFIILGTACSVWQQKALSDVSILSSAPWISFGDLYAYVRIKVLASSLAAAEMGVSDGNSIDVCAQWSGK